MGETPEVNVDAAVDGAMLTLPAIVADPPLAIVTLPPLLLTAPDCVTVTASAEARTVDPALEFRVPDTMTVPAFVAPPTVTVEAPELASLFTVAASIVSVVLAPVVFTTGVATVTVPLDCTVTFVPELKAAPTDAALIALAESVAPTAVAPATLVVEIEPLVVWVEALAAVVAGQAVAVVSLAAQTPLDAAVALVVETLDVVSVWLLVLVAAPTITDSGSSSQAPAAPDLAWASAWPSANSFTRELVSMNPPLPPSPRAAALIRPENTVSLSDQTTTLPPSPPARPSATRLAP